MGQAVCCCPETYLISGVVWSKILVLVVKVDGMSYILIRYSCIYYHFKNVLLNLENTLAISFGSLWEDDNRSPSSVPQEAGILFQFLNAVINTSICLLCIWDFNPKSMPQYFPHAQNSQTCGCFAIGFFNNYSLGKSRTILHLEPRPICKACLITNKYITATNFCYFKLSFLEFHEIKTLIFSVVFSLNDAKRSDL